MLAAAAGDAVSVQSQAVTFVVIGGVFTFLTLWYTTRSKRKDAALAADAELLKEERQDARLAAAAAAQMRLHSKLDVLERHTARIEQSQDVVHAMLNSAQTTQMLAYIVTLKSTRAALRTQHAQLKELHALRAGDDAPPTPEQQVDLDVLAEQILALGLEISANQDAVDDRVRAQELQESQERNRTKLAAAAEAVAEAAKQPIVIDRASITVAQREDGEPEDAPPAAPPTDPEHWAPDGET